MKKLFLLPDCSLQRTMGALLRNAIIALAISFLLLAFAYSQGGLPAPGPGPGDGGSPPADAPPGAGVDIGVPPPAPLPEAEPSEGVKAVREAERSSPFELIRDWRVLSAMIVMLTIILIALAYAFGHAFEMPDVMAWASTELVQAFATVLIIAVFIGTITLLDAIVNDVVERSNIGFKCSDAREGETCGVLVARNYIDGLIDISKDSAKQNIKQAVEKSRLAATRFGAYATQLWPTLQASASGTATAGYIMDVERHNVAAEYHGGIISALAAQEFFVKTIAYRLGPVILVLGIVARSFFLTRRLGGLLIAAAIGILYVFPLMYVANWVTLNMTLFGDSSALPPGYGESCPDACLVGPPEFYGEFGGLPPAQPLYHTSDIYDYIGYEESWSEAHKAAVDDQITTLKENPSLSRIIISGVQRGGIVSDASISSCEFQAHTGDNYCPIECREQPYPLTLGCRNASTKFACSHMDDICKIVRYVKEGDFNSEDVAQYNRLCPSQCRSVPPLNSLCFSNNINQGGCMDTPDYCKFGEKTNVQNNPDAYKMPDGCEEYTNEYCQAHGFPDAGDQCQEGREGHPALLPLRCRASLTAEDSCAYVLPDSSLINNEQCNSCLFVPQAFTFNPPVYNNCADLCSPNPSGPPRVSPADFARRTKEGMVGPEDIKSVASLLLPAYVLPLLNIVVTLMFIRSFSNMLGGDIEIPGIAKII